MKKNSVHILLLLIISWALFYGCAKDDDETNPSGNPPTVMTARDSALLDYNTNYLGSAVTNPGWTGSSSTCTPGTVPQSTHDAVIKRINYFRRIVKLNDDCVLDSSYFAQEQQAALMMSANNSLNHYPPSTWTCYTASGYTGASTSNLALGYHSSGAITGFINDFGSGNEMVGHRRWILHSTTTTFSYGTTNNAMALYVFGAGGNTQIPDYIAYPPKGYIPQTLVFGRWSFSIPNADFSASTVTMNGPSGAVPLTLNTVADGYGDNTLVWEPSGISTMSTSDVTYSVTVSGISNASNTSYSYNVTLIKP